MGRLRIHYFQHVEYETLGCIEEWIKDNKHSLSSTRFYEDDDLPNMNDIDWLIIMGGPMGTFEEDRYPWLKEEKAFIKEAIESNKVVIGICLGSQLIAEVLGSRVYLNNEKEIGFFPVKFNKETDQNEIFKLLPKEIDVFHWHSDTFDLPKRAKLLASSAVCKNQAYVFNEKVVGLQFHFEITKGIIDNLIENNLHELIESNYVQSLEEIKSNYYKIIELNVFMKCLLERLEKFF